MSTSGFVILFVFPIKYNSLPTINVINVFSSAFLLVLEHKLQWKVKVFVAQSCMTLYNLMDCSLPGSSVREILQARILEWAAVPSSRGSSQPRVEPRSSALQASSLPSEPPDTDKIRVLMYYKIWYQAKKSKKEIFNIYATMPVRLSLV